MKSCPAWLSACIFASRSRVPGLSIALAIWLAGGLVPSMPCSGQCPTGDCGTTPDGVPFATGVAGGNGFCCDRNADSVVDENDILAFFNASQECGSSQSFLLSLGDPSEFDFDDPFNRALFPAIFRDNCGGGLPSDPDEQRQIMIKALALILDRDPTVSEIEHMFIGMTDLIDCDDGSGDNPGLPEVVGSLCDLPDPMSPPGPTNLFPSDRDGDGDVDGLDLKVLLAESKLCARLTQGEELSWSDTVAITTEFSGCTDTHGCEIYWAGAAQATDTPISIGDATSLAAGISGCDVPGGCYGPTSSTLCGPGSSLDPGGAGDCDLDSDGKLDGDDLVILAMYVSECDVAGGCDGFSTDPAIKDEQVLDMACETVSSCDWLGDNPLACSQMADWGEQLLGRAITEDELNQMQNCAGCGSSIPTTNPTDGSILPPGGGNIGSPKSGDDEIIYVTTQPTAGEAGDAAGDDDESATQTTEGASNADEDGEDKKVTSDCGDQKSNDDADTDGTSDTSEPASSEPVSLAYGHKIENVVDLVVPVTGPDFRIVRMYTSNPDFLSASGFGDTDSKKGAGLVGEGWSLSCFKALQIVPGGSGTDNLLTVGAPLDRATTFMYSMASSPRLWFALGGATQYIEETSDILSGEVLWRLVDPGKWELDYYGEGGNTSDALVGLIRRHTDQYGNVRTYEYKTYGTAPNQVVRLRTILLNGTATTAEAKVQFDWNVGTTDGAYLGRLAAIRVLRPTGVGTEYATTQVVRYSYKSDNDALNESIGSRGDLVQVTHSVPVHDAPAGVSPRWDRVTQYRYHEGDYFISADGDNRVEGVGYPHQLRAVIEPEQIEFFAQQLNSDGALGPQAALTRAAEVLLQLDFDDPLGFTDQGSSREAQVVDLASKVIDYHVSGGGITPATADLGKVRAQFIQGSCGCATGGSTQGLKLGFSYADITGGGITTTISEYLYDGDSDSDGNYYEDLHRKRIFDIGFRTGDVPYLVNKVFEDDSGTRWIWHYAYDSDDRLIQEYMPSAADSYNAAAALGSRYTALAHGGMIREYGYNSDNRRTSIATRNGTAEPAEVMVEIEYGQSGQTSERDFLVKTIKRYRVAGTSDAGEIETVNYAYTFHSSSSTTSSDIASIQISDEAELESENGPSGTGNEYSTFQLFDDAGQKRWTRLPDNTLVYFDYEGDTGKIAATVWNASPSATSLSPALPSTWGGQSTSGWGLSGGNDLPGGELATTFVHDSLGRVVKSTAPGGVSSYSLVELRASTQRPGILYRSETTLPFKLADGTFDGTATFTLLNADLDPIESSRFTLDTSATYDADPTGGVQYTTVDETWRRATVHLLSGLVASDRMWHDVNGTYHTAEADRYYETAYEYDELGRLVRYIDACGTITETTYDIFDRALTKAVGTSSSDMQTVMELFWDWDGAGSPAQGIGDFNLSVARAHTGEASSGGLSEQYRETVFHYDYRNRLVRIDRPDAPRYETRKYDNLNRVTERAIHGEPSTAPTGVDDQLADRGLHSIVHYSQRGLVYRKQIAIDPTVSSGSATYLESNYCFDENGRIVSAWTPNSPGIKRTFDKNNRVMAIYVTDRGGDDAPGQAGFYADQVDVDSGGFVDGVNLAGDTVLAQAEFSYDGDDKLTRATRYERRHDATATGAPLSSSTAVVTYLGYVYDDADRPTHTIEYGTNNTSADTYANGSAPTVPSTLPSNYLTDQDYATTIINAVAYNARGLVDETTDAKGRVTATFYDDLYRPIVVAENRSTELEIGWSGGAPTAGHWEVLDRAPDDDKDRVTSVVYDGLDRPIKQVAHYFDGASEAAQITEYVYGTSRVAQSTTVTDSLVASFDLLKQIRYPDPSTGLASTAAANTVTYSYNAIGELRSVTDKNGTIHSYTRDSAGRTLSDAADLSWADSSDWWIDTTVTELAYQYDAFGRLSLATTKAGSTVVNEAGVTYTPLWQIQKIRQDVDSALDASVPTGAFATAEVEYSYASAAQGTTNSGNYSRISSFEYPDGTDYDYEFAGVDSRVSRVAAMMISGESQSLVKYQYLGLSRFAVIDYPTIDINLNMQVAHNGTTTAGVYEGWDRHGRLKTQRWVDGDFGPHATYSDTSNFPAIFEQSYTYDRVDNRLGRIDDRPGAHVPWRDQAFDYDNLDRVVEQRRGAFDSGSGDVVNAAGFGLEWKLDQLSRWNEFRRDLDGDAVYDETGEVQSRAYNESNEITALDDDDDSTTDRTPGFDDAGNMREVALAAGGSTRYIHDAWNRLVKVAVWDGTTATNILENDYNALHWRVLKRNDADNATLGVDQQKAYYYDASWRIVEEHTDTTYDPDEHVDDRIAQQFWGIRYIDDAVARRVKAYVETDPTNNPGVFAWTDWELYHYVTDSIFSVVALVSDNANSDVAERVSYDAYGTARHRRPAGVEFTNTAGDVDVFDLTAYLDAYYDTGNNEIGDSGSSWVYSADYDLDRNGTLGGSLDLPNYLNWWFPNSAALEPPAGDISERDNAAVAAAVAPDNEIGYAGAVYNPESGLYLMRYRWYMPELGIFMETDPLGYVDGMNLYEHVGSSPAVYTDPLGLSWWNPISWGLGGASTKTLQKQRDRNCASLKKLYEDGKLCQDDYMMLRRNGHCGGSVSEEIDQATGEGFREGFEDGKILVADATSQIVTAGGLLPWLSGAEELHAMHDAIMAANSGNWLYSVADVSAYVTNVAAALAAIVLVYDAVAGETPAENACFVAGTLILTAHGLVPIEQVDVGERVITTDRDAIDTEVDPVSWKRVFLFMPNPEAPSDIVKVEMLRPAEWLESIDAAIGTWIDFGFPEMGLFGPAQIAGIDPCPEIEEGVGRVVLTTVNHMNGDVLELRFEGSDDLLEPTGAHRFFSEDRQDWVPAATLQVGERIRTTDGTATIASVARKEGVYRVYNLHVESEHCYYVTDLSLLVHNACPRGQIGDNMSYDEHLRHGDPSEWKYIGEKPGSGVPGRTTPENSHIYEIWEDANGDPLEIHYWRRPDGTIYDPRIKPYSP